MDEHGQGGNFESLEDRERRARAETDTAQASAADPYADWTGTLDPPLRRRGPVDPAALQPRAGLGALPGSTPAKPAKAPATKGQTRLGCTAMAVVAALVVWGLYALASGGGSSASPTVVATTPPADGGSYADAAAVLAALAAGGAPCATPSPVSNPTAAGATSMVGCFSSQAAGGASSDSVVVVFDNHADALAFAQGMLGLVPAAGDPAAEVVGVNWVVNTVPAYGNVVQTALGGNVLTSVTATTAAAVPPPPPVTTQAPPAAQTVTYVCAGHAGDGVDITYGAEGSSSDAHHLPFSHTDPLDATAQYFAVQAQLSGSGTVTCTTTVDWTDGSGDAQSVTQTGTANGGYNIASAEVCGDFEGGWQAC
jgi:hypothetical protein